VKTPYKFAPFYALCLMLLVGCAAFQKPATLEQDLAYAYGTQTALLDAAANALNAGVMTRKEGEQVLKLADDTRTVLDSAKLAFEAGDLQTAKGQLAMATAILIELRDYVNSRAKP
jgi:hypothetical protein